MRTEQFLSVGIDIGTSTTQCVFSLLTLSNTASSFSVPRIRITDKKILYRAPVRLTPLLDSATIDADSLESMIQSAYADARIDPADIRLGAVIITGETARKANARSVTDALSRLAGDFVVATAGPALESILAGRGSGAEELSSEKGRNVLNLDIGGGTANLALFSGGNPICEGCYSIGGRLLRFRDDDHTVLSFTPSVDLIARDAGVVLSEGKCLTDSEIEQITNRMAQVLEEAANLRERSALHDRLTVEHGLPDDVRAELFTFSGGVADCVYGQDEQGTVFHDLGGSLGRALARSRFFSDQRVLRPAETSHATVIGAGAYSVAVSGSTIQYQGMKLPIKSLPVANVRFSSPEDIPGLSDAIRRQFDIFDGECAVYMDGIPAITWGDLQGAAKEIAEALREQKVKIVILKEDMAKALGQALARCWGSETPFLCLDGIELMYGDTVDIGAPLGGGRVIPVIVKTFAFSQDARR